MMSNPRARQSANNFQGLARANPERFDEAQVLQQPLRPLMPHQREQQSQPSNLQRVGAGAAHSPISGGAEQSLALNLPLKPSGLNPLGGAGGAGAMSHQQALSRGTEHLNLKAIREKFQRYLTLLYHDLCAKTNGLTKKEVDEYTFLKYSQLPGYLATRLFNLMKKQEMLPGDDEGTSVILMKDFVETIANVYCGQFVPQQNGQAGRDESGFIGEIGSNQIIPNPGSRPASLTKKRAQLNGTAADPKQLQIIFNLQDLRSILCRLDPGKKGHLTREDTKVILFHSLILYKKQFIPTALQVKLIELLNFKKGKKKSKSKIVESILTEAFGPAPKKELPKLAPQALFSQQIVSVGSKLDQSKVITFEEFKSQPPLFFYLLLNVIKLSLPCSQYYSRLLEAHQAPAKSKFVTAARGGHVANDPQRFSLRFGKRNNNEESKNPLSRQEIQENPGSKGSLQNQQAVQPGKLQQQQDQRHHQSAQGDSDQNLGEDWKEGDDEEMPENKINQTHSITRNKKSKSDIKCLTYKPCKTLGIEGARENRFQQGGLGARKRMDTSHKSRQRMDEEGFDKAEEDEEDAIVEEQAIVDMGEFEEGDEDDSDSIDEDNFEEFMDDDDLANIPLFNVINSNFHQLNREDQDMIDQQYQVPMLRPQRMHAARNTRLINMEESHQQRMHGPLAGSAVVMASNINYSSLAHSNAVSMAVSNINGSNVRPLNGEQYPKIHNKKSLFCKNSIVKEAKEEEKDDSQQFMHEIQLAGAAANGGQRTPERNYRDISQPSLNRNDKSLLKRPGLAPPIDVQRKCQTFEGFVIFKSSNSQIKRYFLSLQDSDLYCYENEVKDKMKFMHSLVGAFVIDTTQQDPEMVDGRPHRKLEIKISEFFKRIFYIPCREGEPLNLSSALSSNDSGMIQLKLWIEKLRLSQGHRMFSELYEKVPEADGGLLGEGSFGKVFKAKSKSSGELVAVKNIDKSTMDRFEMQLQITEIELLKVIGSHPSIIKLLDVFEDDKHFYIVLEYLGGRDLFEYMNRNFMNEAKAKRIMYSVLRAVKYLHSFGIVHRDIKLENIVMSSRDNQIAVPKLIDFGLSKIFLANEKSTDKFGTIAYCPPEILLGKEHWSCADVWSLGICLHVTLTNRVPFVSLDKKQTVKNIVEQKLNFNQSGWYRISNQAKDLVNRMLDKSAETRPTIEAVLSHEWLITVPEIQVQQQPR